MFYKPIKYLNSRDVFSKICHSHLIVRVKICYTFHGPCLHGLPGNKPLAKLMQIQIYNVVELQIYFSCQHTPLKVGITHSPVHRVLYEMWIIFSWLVINIGSLGLSSLIIFGRYFFHPIISWHHCQCKVGLTVVNNASICMIISRYNISFNITLAKSSVKCILASRWETFHQPFLMVRIGDCPFSSVVAEACFRVLLALAWISQRNTYFYYRIIHWSSQSDILDDLSSW